MGAVLGTVLTMIATKGDGKGGASILPAGSQPPGALDQDKPVLPRSGGDRVWVMPMVPPGNLTTAQLLDANPGVSAAEAGQLMQQHQKLFCRGGKPDIDIGSSDRVERVQLDKFALFVYKGKDIVSDHLKGTAKSWESSEVKHMEWALQAPVPPPGTAAQGKLPPPRTWAPPSKPFMIDVGANIGWFTMNAVAFGANVAAFEAMSENILLLRTTLCGNPGLSDRVTLFGTGLGTKRSTCHMISGDGNRGDGFSICDRDPMVDINNHAKGGNIYLLRGMMTTMRLDGLVDEDVQMMKMDIEGFELEALKGASGLLERRNVWFIIIECNVGMIGHAKKNEMLKFLDGIGYTISNVGFQGPWILEEAIRKDMVMLGGVNLFAVKKSYLAANGTAPVRRLMRR